VAFVDHTAEESCPANGGVDVDVDRLGWRIGRPSSKGAALTMTVEMIGVESQHGFQMALGEDQQPGGGVNSKFQFPLSL
jgi:hypothetical protein